MNYIYKLCIFFAHSMLFFCLLVPGCSRIQTFIMYSGYYESLEVQTFQKEKRALNFGLDHKTYNAFFPNFQNYIKIITRNPAYFLIRVRFNCSPKMAYKMSTKAMSDGMHTLCLYTKTFNQEFCKNITSVFSYFYGIICSNEVMWKPIIRGQFSPVYSNNIYIVSKIFDISCKYTWDL